MSSHADIMDGTDGSNKLPPILAEQVSDRPSTATDKNFQFPFFDNDQNLDLSKSHQTVVTSPLKQTGISDKNEMDELGGVEDLTNSILSPSGFGAMTLSPIAKNCNINANATSTSRVEKETENFLNHTSESDHEVKENEFITSLDGDDLEHARKKVGETSSRFIDRLRNAAHKRKVAVARSRDSLVAKEQQQLRSIAESKATKANENNAKRCQPHANQKHPRRFNSGNLPKSARGTASFSGLGVPKVEKRPATTPQSPLLGSRRRQVAVKANHSSSQATSSGRIPKLSNTSSRQYERNRYRLPISARIETGDSNAFEGFKARPLPPSTGTLGGAGQLGVPKVLKRSTTIPISPLLGRKREENRNTFVPTRKTSLDAPLRPPSLDARGDQHIAEARMARTPASSDDSGLLGLGFLASTPDSAIEGNICICPNSSLKPFEPRSTKRAIKRAQYDSACDCNRQLQLEEERKRLKSQIKVIQKELLLLSQKI